MNKNREIFINTCKTIAALIVILFLVAIGHPKFKL
jgi:hypothetical protein